MDQTVVCAGIETHCFQTITFPVQDGSACILGFHGFSFVRFVHISIKNAYIIQKNLAVLCACCIYAF